MDLFIPQSFVLLDRFFTMQEKIVLSAEKLICIDKLVYSKSFQNKKFLILVLSVLIFLWLLINSFPTANVVLKFIDLFSA